MASWESCAAVWAREPSARPRSDARDGREQTLASAQRDMLLHPPRLSCSRSPKRARPVPVPSSILPLHFP
ncbi:hypothetical protein BD413DRAFT_507402, partial [Trametes elegans]